MNQKRFRIFGEIFISLFIFLCIFTSFICKRSDGINIELESKFFLYYGREKAGIIEFNFSDSTFNYRIFGIHNELYGIPGRFSFIAGKLILNNKLDLDSLNANRIKARYDSTFNFTRINFKHFLYNEIDYIGIRIDDGLNIYEGKLDSLGFVYVPESTLSNKWQEITYHYGYHGFILEIIDLDPKFNDYEILIGPSNEEIYHNIEFNKESFVFSKFRQEWRSENSKFKLKYCK